MTCNPETLMQSAACLDCLTTKQLEMVKAYLLCQLFTMGGSGALSALKQVFSGSGEPTITPTATDAIWINTDDQTMRTWFSNAWH
jgi:hypothetical protein